MENILGLDIENKMLKQGPDLPLFIHANYDIEVVRMAGVDCVIMVPIDDMGTADTIKKHMAIIKEAYDLPVAIRPVQLSTFRRESFIQNRIPFLTEKQVYLPFLGTYLEKRTENPGELTPFTLATQTALIRWLLHPTERIRVTELMKDMGYTPMTMSRVAKQLGTTECFEIEKEGAANVLVAKHSARETYAMLAQYMSTPVKWTGYVDLPIEAETTIAGIEAVAERTMLSPDGIHTYAVTGFDKKQLHDECIDPSKQAIVEVWKYDPGFALCEDGFADPVSVALSLRNNKDERVQAAVEDMLNDVWRTE